MINDPLIRQLALNEAKGYQQRSLVEQLLDGKVSITYEQIFPGSYKYQRVAYGVNKLGGSSVGNLKKRLTKLGFRFDRIRDTVKKIDQKSGRTYEEPVEFLNMRFIGE